MNGIIRLAERLRQLLKGVAGIFLFTLFIPHHAPAKSYHDCIIRTDTKSYKCYMAGNFYLVGERFYAGIKVIDLKKHGFSESIGKLKSDKRYIRVWFEFFEGDAELLSARIKWNGSEKLYQARISKDAEDNIVTVFELKGRDFGIASHQNIQLTLRL